MRFDNTPPDGGSYEQPKVGKYIGVLVGFAFVGTQPGGQYGPKKKCMLRWELHKRKGPSKDSKDFMHTITQTYGATIRGEGSLLRKSLEAHGIEGLDKGGNSQDWLGKAAWLDLELSDDGKYVNVKGVSKLDPDDDPMPDQVLPGENWDGSDGTTCPGWASWAVARSTDLTHLAPERKPATPGDSATPAAVPVGRASECPDEDIPF